MVKSLKFHFSAWLMLISVTASAQNWTNLQSIGDTTGNTSISAMIKYGENQIAMVGKYESRTLKFGNTTLTNSGGSDAFVAISDTKGNFSWAMSLGGKGDELATSIATDKAGNLYVGGSFTSLSINFGSTTFTNKGNSDGFLVKINQQKQIDWAMQFGALNTDELTNLKVSSTDDVFAIVSSTNQNTINYTVNLYKIDATKKIVWQRNGSTNGYDSKFTSLELDSQDNCYIAGGFSDKLTFEGKHTINSIKPEPGQATSEGNGFVVKYNTDGLFIKMTPLNSVSCINDIAIFGQNLYITGEIKNFGFGWGWPLMDSKIILQKLDSNLAQVWIKSAGGLTALQSLDISQALAIDEKENIYLTGYFFSDKLIFNQASLFNIKHKDYYYQQAFLLKYKSNGDEEYGKVIGAELCETGTALLLFSEDKFLMAGTYESAKITEGIHTIINNGIVKELYVHLRPTRQSRNTFAFIARMGDLPNSIANVDLDNPVELYYATADEKLTIIFANPTVQRTTIKLISIDGTTKLSIDIMSGEKQLQIAMSHLNSGMYLVKIYNENKTITRKILKR